MLLSNPLCYCVRFACEISVLFNLVNLQELNLETAVSVEVYLYILSVDVDVINDAKNSC